MKNLLKVPLLLLLACSPNTTASEPLFPLQEQCVAEDLREWVITKNTAISNLKLPVSMCEKADKITVQGNSDGVITLTKNVFTSVANTISLTANFSGTCNADIDLQVDNTKVTYAIYDKIQALRVPVRPGTVTTSVTIHTKESCPVSLSILTEKDF